MSTFDFQEPERRSHTPTMAKTTTKKKKKVKKTKKENLRASQFFASPNVKHQSEEKFKP